MTREKWRQAPEERHGTDTDHVSLWLHLATKYGRGDAAPPELGGSRLTIAYRYGAPN